MSTQNAIAAAITDGKRRAMMSVDDVADELGCSPRHVRRMIDAGRCPKPVRLGSLIRFPRQVIDDWIGAGCPNVRNASKSRGRA